MGIDRKDTMRNSNIELLRIVSMFMIIGLHYFNGEMGGGLLFVSQNSVNYWLTHIFESIFITGVNIFVCITA